MPSLLDAMWNFRRSLFDVVFGATPKMRFAVERHEANRAMSKREDANVERSDNETGAVHRV